MSGSLAEASAASVDGYPLYDMKALGEFSTQMPAPPPYLCSVQPREIVDFLKSPRGMSAYEKWACKKLPINPDDAVLLMVRLQTRFLELGLPKTEAMSNRDKAIQILEQLKTLERSHALAKALEMLEKLYDLEAANGSTGGAAPPSSDGATTVTLGA